MLSANGKYISIVFLTLYFISFNFNSYSQNSKSANLDNEEISSLTTKLSKKIILSEAQIKQVTSILGDYSKQLNEIRSTNSNSVPDEISMKQLMTSSGEKIFATLDDKQKMKFDIIKNDWWKEITVEAND